MSSRTYLHVHNMDLYCSCRNRKNPALQSKADGLVEPVINKRKVVSGLRCPDCGNRFLILFKTSNRSSSQFEVEQGIIHVNSIRVLQCTNEVICFSADFKQKYAEDGGFQDDGSITFYASDNTLHVMSKNARPTKVFVKNIPKHWACIKSSVQMGRYSALVILVKEEPDYKKFKHWSDQS